MALAANIQDRDGVFELLRDARRRFPFIAKIFADAGYQRPKAARKRRRGERARSRSSPKPNERGFVCHILGVDAGKEQVLARLRRAEPGPGFCHFPAGRDLDFFRGLTAERRVRSFRRGVAFFQWLKDRSANNEPLDCRVYALAVLQGLVARGLRLDAEAARPSRIRSSWMTR